MRAIHTVLVPILVFTVGACSHEGKRLTEGAPATAAPEGGAGDGTQALPPGHPPLGGMPAGHPPLDAPTASEWERAARPRDTALEWTVPEGWTSSPPANAMRVGQYRLPGGIECVLFGNAIGGSTKENLDRWIGQFSQPDGRPSSEVAELTSSERDGLTISRLSITGTYSANFMGGAAADAGDAGTPATRLLAAVIEQGGDRVFAKLVGPAADVEAAEAAFDALVASFRADE